MQKKKGSNLIFVLLSIIIIVLIFLAVNIVRLFNKPIETTLVKNGELIKYEEVTGYIVRDETVIDLSNYDGVMQVVTEDLNKVRAGGVIANFVSSSEKDLMKKIEELDKKIEEAMETQQTIYPSDVKALDASIQVELYENIKNNNDINSIKENKSKVNTSIKKKAQIVGELSPVGSKLKELINERNDYEKQINNGKKELISPRSGIVSYRVDGYENNFTKDNISNMTWGDLSSYKLNSNQMVPVSNKNVKVVNNFESYIAIFMNSPESKNANLNDKLYLRFQNTGENLIPASIEYISEEAGGRLIVLKIQENNEELTKYRKINLDVVWWSYTGFKLHKSVISQKEVTNVAGQYITTLSSVTIPKAGYNETAYVKIVKEFGDYVIVDNYTDKEYLDMGFTEEDIKNFVTIKMYTEVLVNEQ